MPDGTLVAAIDQPFTHILKPAGTAGFEMLPIVEWLCPELGWAAGFEVPDAALIEMPDGISPPLVVERFDIRRGSQDDRRLEMEDFCSSVRRAAYAPIDGSCRGHRHPVPPRGLRLVDRQWRYACSKPLRRAPRLSRRCASRRSTTLSPRASSRALAATGWP
nr:HipA domain-containing protein [Mesorhizobium sp. NZP2077]